MPAVKIFTGIKDIKILPKIKKGIPETAFRSKGYSKNMTGIRKKITSKCIQIKREDNRAVKQMKLWKLKFSGKAGLHSVLK